MTDRTAPTPTQAATAATATGDDGARTRDAGTAGAPAGAAGDDEARAAEILREHRDSIDRLDAILVYTLGERFKHTQAVGRLKAAHDLPPADPAREARQIARLEDLARRADLDPDFAKKFLAFIIQEVIKHHEAQKS
jgi:chorismate mutase